MNIEWIESLPEVTEVSAHDVVVVVLHSDSLGPKLRKITVGNLKHSLRTAKPTADAEVQAEAVKPKGKEK